MLLDKYIDNTFICVKKIENLDVNRNEQIFFYDGIEIQ